MSEQRVLKAIKSRTRTLSFNNCELKSLPPSLGRLDFLISLSAKSNGLEELPQDISKLSSLCYLNLGCNELTDCSLPLLERLHQLTTLHLFSNSLCVIPESFFVPLRHLRLLNLNHNQLSSLPAQIGCLQALEQLSLSHNRLNHLPAETAELGLLQELYVDNNVLTTLPKTLGALGNLKKLLAHKNKLRSLPNSIGTCRRLRELDVSSNKLELFPSTLCELKLKEFHCDSNPLLPYIPVPAQQQEEVLRLKEMASRMMIKELKTNAMLVWLLEQDYPELKRVLSNAGYCALCGQPFLHSWLQCVQFLPVKEVLPTLKSVPSSTHLPIRATLCSYRCFNSEGHSFYGIAA